MGRAVVVGRSSHPGRGAGGLGWQSPEGQGGPGLEGPLSEWSCLEGRGWAGGWVLAGCLETPVHSYTRAPGTAPLKGLSCWGPFPPQKEEQQGQERFLFFF